MTRVQKPTHPTTNSRPTRQTNRPAVANARFRDGDGRTERQQTESRQTVANARFRSEDESSCAVNEMSFVERRVFLAKGSLSQMPASMALSRLLSVIAEIILAGQPVCLLGQKQLQMPASLERLMSPQARSVPRQLPALVTEIIARTRIPFG